MIARHEQCPGAGRPPAKGSLRGPCATGYRGDCRVCGRNMQVWVRRDSRGARRHLICKHVDFDRKIAA